MKKYIGLSFLALSFVGCSPLQKALKSEDMELKKEVANQLYEQKKYKRSIRLYEQMESSFKGRPDAEEIFYNFSNATFIVKDYTTAISRLNYFANAYPQSEHREEALLNEIKSGIALSPVYSLDQTMTYRTIDKLQSFIDLYPSSDYVFEANSLMSSLNKKLELKAFENAKQLNTIGGWTRNYTAAIIALDNFIYDYPGTELKEDALFYKLDSAYKLAMNSVHTKEEERLINAKAMYETLIRFNEQTKFASQAENMIDDINSKLEKFSK